MGERRGKEGRQGWGERRHALPRRLSAPQGPSFSQSLKSKADFSPLFPSLLSPFLPFFFPSLLVCLSVCLSFIFVFIMSRNRTESSNYHITCTSFRNYQLFLTKLAVSHFKYTKNHFQPPDQRRKRKASSLFLAPQCFPPLWHLSSPALDYCLCIPLHVLCQLGTWFYCNWKLVDTAV